MDNRERIDRSDRQDLPVPKRWAKDPASLKPWTLKYFDSKIGPINGLDEIPRPSGPRRPTRMVAGTKQVVSLLREGCSAHAILARLKMRPARLREIVASKGFQRMVELEWRAMRSGMLLRLGRNVSEAAGLLTMVGEFGEPEAARKAALNVLQLAMQPPTQLPARIDLKSVV